MTELYGETGMPDIGDPDDEKFRRLMAFGALQDGDMNDAHQDAIVEMVFEISATSEVEESPS